MFKFEFKESSATLLGVAILIIAVAIIGTNPLSPSTVLNAWGRVALGTLGIILLTASLLLFRSSFKSRDPGSTDAEYHERFRAAQERLASLTPENMIVMETTFGKAKIDVINGNILDSRADIIVSSDDNYFGARGGVAKAIMEKAGSPVAEELERYRRKQFRQGQLVVTTGGNWDCRAIVHPAVIDLE